MFLICNYVFLHRISEQQLITTGAGISPVLPASRRRAVVQSVAGAAAVVSVGYRRGNTGGVGGQFWGGSEVPGRGGAGPGEQNQSFV